MGKTRFQIFAMFIIKQTKYREIVNLIKVSNQKLGYYKHFIKQ